MRIFVGLSGGVDSAVSAALLKEQGYNVVGAFIKIWSPEFIECTWKEDRLDAMRVCAALQIPFKEIDLSNEYKNEVVQSMLAQYQKGITPNPDILCNRSIKFGHFAKWAFESGADLIATGHYARIRKEGNSFQLLRGKDTGKDQSYFLYRLGREDLARTLFPIGEFQKAHVRKLADKFGLPNARRADSQGLCFVGDVSMKEFLSRFIQLKEGVVVDEHGATIGSHSGAALYTVGERHGFTTNDSSVHYVTSVDIEKNIVQVSRERASATRTSVPLSDMHLIATDSAVPLKVVAQARYREKPFETEILQQGNSFVANFAQPQIAAPGQSLVLYDGVTCLGGAIINR